MKTRLLVTKKKELTPPCVIEGKKVYERLTAIASKLERQEYHTTLVGTGTKESPFQIQEFKQINSYIKKRDSGTTESQESNVRPDLPRVYSQA